MICPRCGSKTLVIDTRHRKSGKTYRRNACKTCGLKFSTNETYIKDYTKPQAFIKRR